MTTTLSDEITHLHELAAALRDAESTRIAVPTPSMTHPGLTLPDAYTVQRLNISRRIAAGEKIIGRKIGLTSLAMQQQLGVDEPDFGVITDAMVLPAGGTLDATRLVAPRAEPEFAFRIGCDLPSSPTARQLRHAIDGVAVAIEIIDSRVADWKITLVDTVADNASSARIVYGEIVPATAELLAGLPDAVIRMSHDGQEVAVGPGSAVLGDPIIALEWLGRAIGAFGDSFRAGDVVLAGAVAAAVPVTPGSVFAATAHGLPPVSFTVSEVKEEER